MKRLKSTKRISNTQNYFLRLNQHQLIMKCLELGDKIGTTNVANLLTLIDWIIFTLSMIFYKIYQCPPEIALIFRGGFGLLFLLGYCHCSKSKLQSPSQDLHLVLIRTFCVTSNQLVLFISLSNIPISLTLTMSNTGPLFVILFNYLIYGQTIQRINLCGLFLSLVGILLVINRDYFQNEPLNIKDIMFSLLVLFARGIWAYGILLVKDMSEDTSSVQVSFYLGISMVLLGVVLGLTHSNLIISKPNYIFLVFTVGIPLGICHSLFVVATMLTSNIGSTTLFAYSGVILGYLEQIWVQGQEIHFLAILGSGVAAIGLYLSLKV